MRHILFSLILIISLSFTSAFAAHFQAGDRNCFTILVGKKATADGSVLLAHNEDDFGATVVNWYKVPSFNHKQHETVHLRRGEVLEQVPRTYGFLWLEMPGYEFSDSYMNQWGVTIVSNQCSSKERPIGLTYGIGYYLRRLMAERAKTARQAVKIAGKLIERFGYVASGRTYCIADRNEAWMLAVVQGKHWVAQRVPDSMVAIIPNYYTIGEVNLKDTLNFLGAPDLVEYAVRKGWYDPHSGKPFNFRQAYGDPLSLAHYSNIARHWVAINLLAAKHYAFNARLPFAFKGKAPITVQDLMDVLRNHYEGTELEMNPSYNHGNPHKNVIMRICSQTNRYGLVAQLRSWLPPEIGDVLWVAPRRPCVQPFVPWYSGITKIPDAYTTKDYQTALKIHFDPQTRVREYVPQQAYWSFTHFAARIDSNYAQDIPAIRAYKRRFQQAEFASQKKFENEVLKEFKKNRTEALRMLTDYTKERAEKALQKINR